MSHAGLIAGTNDRWHGIGFRPVRHARLAELADAPDSKSGTREGVPVQVGGWAQCEARND